VNLAIAVICALCAAFCFALGSLFQQGAARQTAEGSLQLRLLARLLHEPRWLAGVALSAGSFLILAVALAFGPLSLVQPLVATEIVIALPLIAHRSKRRLTRKDIIGAATVTAGMAVFIAVSPPLRGLTEPGLSAWIPAFIGIGALMTVAGTASMRSRGAVRVIWLAAAAGAVYGLLDALAKSSVGVLETRGLGAVATTWEPYALAAAGVLGGLFGQSAFHAGPLSLSLPVIDTLEPVAAVVLATTVFRERLASSPWQLALQLAGGALAVAGIAILSHSSIVSTEFQLAPEAASPGHPREARGS
jgi:drug/metabolite transporter (DMT)-like permease